LKGGFPDVDVTARLGAGPAYKEIVRVADDEQADLIVVGAQGHGLLEHLLSGSNAQQVIRRATCAVLTVRPPKEIASAKDRQPGIAPTQSREATL
jgi:nucleotide-binding universal stress UspA family protein